VFRPGVPLYVAITRSCADRLAEDSAGCASQATGAVVDDRLVTKQDAEQGYRACLGLLALARGYREARLEAGEPPGPDHYQGRPISPILSMDGGARGGRSSALYSDARPGAGRSGSSYGGGASARLETERIVDSIR